VGFLFTLIISYDCKWSLLLFLAFLALSEKKPEGDLNMSRKEALPRSVFLPPPFLDENISIVDPSLSDM